MTKAIILTALLACASSQANTLEPIKQVVVNQGQLVLNMADFKPILQRWAGRDVEVGYEAYVDVVNTAESDTLFFDAQGEITAKWFASNFAMTARMSCSGIAAGASKVYGKRLDAQSYPAKPQISELRHGMSQCKQLKIELAKEGALSRQFYTKIEQIDFTVALHSSQQGGL